MMNIVNYTKDRIPVAQKLNLDFSSKEDHFVLLKKDSYGLKKPTNFYSEEDLKNKTKEFLNYKCTEGFVVLNDVTLHRGVIFTKHNKILDLNFCSFMPKKEIQIPQNQDICIDEPTHFINEICYLFLPSYGHFKNFGSFLASVIPTLLECHTLDKKIPTLLPALTDWQQRLISFYFDKDLNIKSEKIKMCGYDWPNWNKWLEPNNYSVFFKKVIIPIKQGCIFLSKTSADFLKKYQIKPTPNNKIYLSRLNRNCLKKNKRVFVNEQIIIEYLKQLNFQIIEPDEISFETLFKKLKECSVVMGAGGAGMFNTIVCNDSKIISIEAAEWYSPHSKLFSLANLDYNIYHPSSPPSIQGVNQNLKHPNFLVDFKYFKNFLDKIL